MFKCPAEKCQKCLRLVAFRHENEQKYPTYYNGAVESFGDLSAQILIVGLAPGLHGANQTGRPFTNDFAGDMLYLALKKHGLASGPYLRRKDDGLTLLNIRVTNSVRCVPPQNKVTGEEVKNCGSYLIEEIKAMPNLKIIMTLGSVAHNAVLGVLGYKKSQFKFAHGALHYLPDHHLMMLNTYHTSRYNVNTGVLTEQMFDEIIQKLKSLLQ
ncbi:MAG: uracil-DNA glycosylase [Alphaproteobacteria bacterium]|nr:uracil-DNA glycosylase [Alphaproteobacteria bacterium]